MLNKQMPYLIGETAFHHEGDVDFLFELVNEGIEAGADALKFHLLFDIEDYMVGDHAAIDVIKNIAIPKDKWHAVLAHVSAAKVDIILLCNDVSSLQWANENQHNYNIVAIEIHATGLNDVFMLKEAANFASTVILGVGGSTFDEIKYAVDLLGEKGKNDVFLMHGFQNYPTMYEDINLKRMRFLKDAFELNVGYADHTDPADKNANLISVLPQAMGFNVLEKHFTHKYGEKRIDAQAAVSIADFKEVKSLMKTVMLATGINNLTFSTAEKKYGNTGPMKKAIVARHGLKAGSILQLEDIAFKRTNNSANMRQNELTKLIGNKLNRDIDKDQLIDISVVDYNFNVNDFSQFFIKK